MEATPATGTPTPAAPPGTAPDDRSVGRRLARLTTEVLAPSVLVTVMPLVIAARATGSLGGLLRWGGAALFFCAVVPIGVIVYGVRRGWLTDRHIGDHTQRLRPLGLGLTSVAVGIALLAAFDPPRLLFALMVATLVNGAAVTAVNHWWKLSVHVATAAGSVIILILVFGAALHALWPLVAAVAWSRVRLRDHTLAQVIAGATVGVPLTAVTFLALT
ncbi:phosphoesterase PA-phosphatase [Micromonospora phytophila]|uniref:phosphoesterase PA-phosphatase n=1 Tax=Micromonospora phytophila TaxID=709888 RepID=UPI00202F9BA7|nr:phosphoesterase PA-phosphatase [Micromonospora phytophila]MCM0676576.1 phosphoesterase PA-phosphatase [Micromonospora phytophila]